MRAVLSQEGLAVRSCALGHAQLPRLNSMAVKPAKLPEQEHYVTMY